MTVAPRAVPVPKDNDREGFSLRKAGAFLKLKLLNLFGVGERSAHLEKLSRDALLEVVDVKPFTLPDGTKRRGLLVFDFDDTLAVKDATSLPASSLAMMKQLQADGFELAVLSNKQYTAQTRPRYAPLEAMGVLVVRNVAAKPSVKAFEGALDQVSAKLGVTVKPASAAMIGDKASTDGGSALAGIDFIEVEKFSGAGR